jgi:hypothetical protein
MTIDAAPALVLVHGPAHGPWCWEVLQRHAAAAGLRREAIALPSCGPDPGVLGGPDDDIAARMPAAR